MVVVIRHEPIVKRLNIVINCTVNLYSIINSQSSSNVLKKNCFTWTQLNKQLNNNSVTYISRPFIWRAFELTFSWMEEILPLKYFNISSTIFNVGKRCSYKHFKNILQKGFYSVVSEINSMYIAQYFIYVYSLYNFAFLIVPESIKPLNHIFSSTTNLRLLDSFFIKYVILKKILSINNTAMYICYKRINNNVPT